MKATIRKGREGWEARTTIELDAPHILEISTYKSSRGLVTTATRMEKTDGGSSFIMFEDFHSALIQSKERCTEKTITAQHTAALADIEGIKAKCAAWYAAKALKEAA